MLAAFANRPRLRKDSAKGSDPRRTIQQPHIERPFVVGSQADPAFKEELPHIRLEPDAFGRFPAAGGAGLDEHPVADLARACEPLHILETVVAAEAADGLTLLFDKLQPRMLFEGLPQLLQFAVNRFLAQGWRKRRRVKKDVDVF